MNSTQIDFEKEVLRSDLPVLVDFTAEWCGPCQAIAPIIESLAEDYAGRAKVVKVDVDANSEIGARYSVMSIPTLVVFKDGQEAERLVGAAQKSAIESLLKRYL
ncbi:MAG: thioredoxin [Armatimonadetes bacterium]|nr:thioredoxin [Armatimonadota bacterium]